MRRLAVGGALLGLLSVAGPAESIPFQIPEPHLRTLPNGLRVAVFPDSRLPMVQIQLRVDAGISSEAAGEEGAAYLVAELLRDGSVTRDRADFERALGGMAGSFSAVPGRDYTTISGTFAARDLDFGLDLVSDPVLHPLFPEEAFQRARSQALRNWMQVQAGPLLADEQLWSLAFGDHPYGRGPFGARQTQGSITLDKVREFHRKRFVPSGSVLAIAGDVQPDSAFRLAERWLGSWSGDVQGPVAKPVTRAAKPRVRILDRPSMPAAEVRIGFYAPPSGSPEELPVAFADYALGNGPGSKLARLARTLPGISPRSNYVPLRDGGFFIVGATAPVESASVVIERLLGTVRSLSDPLPAADVDRVKRVVRNTYPVQFETLGAIVSAWLATDYHRATPKDAQGYQERVAALTPATLAEGVRRGMDLAAPSLVVMGPADPLRASLERFGTVEVVGTLDLLPTPPPAPAYEPTAEEKTQARERVKKAVTAHGGLAKLKAVKASSIEADITLTMPGQVFEGTLTQVRKDPYRMLQVTQLGGVEIKQGLIGREAWRLEPGGAGVRELDSLNVTALRASFTADVAHLLLAASDPKAEVWVAGAEPVTGRQATKVELASPEIGRRTLLIDEQNHRLVGVEQQESGGMSLELVPRRIFSDFQTVAGVLWPHAEDRMLNGEPVVQVRVKKITLNQKVSDETFWRPSGQ